MMVSLMMLRRSYAYTSLGFIAVWILLNVAYVNRLASDSNAALPHLKHGRQRHQGQILKISLTERPSITDEDEDVERISLTKDELLDIENGVDRHSFNVTASNRIPLDRKVPNFKPHG